MILYDAITKHPIELTPSVTDDSVYVFMNNDRTNGFKIFLTHCVPMGKTFIQWTGVYENSYEIWHSLGREIFTPGSMNDELYVCASQVSFREKEVLKSILFTLSWEDRIYFASYLIGHAYDHSHK